MSEVEDAKTGFDVAVAGPGGGLTALLLWPMGCTTDTVIDKEIPCVDGEPTNLFGSTMGGLVGQGGSATAFFLGCLMALVIFAGLRLYRRHT